jgi:hypothetical protein
LEGGEGKVVQGMRRILQEVRPLLFIELHGLRAARAVWQELEACSYRVVCLKTEPYVEISRVDQLRWKEHVLAFPGCGSAARRRGLD